MQLVLYAVLIVGGAVALALGLQALIYRFVAPRTLSAAQGVVGGLFIQPISGLYGVLVAFLLAGALAAHQSIRSNLMLEVDAMIDLGRLAHALPEPACREVSDALGEYARSIVEDEWQLLKEGHGSPQTTMAFSQLWHAVSTYAPATAGEANLHARALELIGTLGTQRRLRILSSNLQFPALLWAILILGAVITISLGTYSALGSHPLQASFIASLAAIIALSLYVLFVLNNPFAAELGTIGPERISEVREMLEELR